MTHRHSTATCSGRAYIQYRDAAGHDREWIVGAWLCPDDAHADTEHSIREHLRRHLPDATLLSVRLVRDGDDQ